MFSSRSAPSNLFSVHSGISIRLISDEGPYRKRRGRFDPGANAKPPQEQVWRRWSHRGRAIDQLCVELRCVARDYGVIYAVKRVRHASSGVAAGRTTRETISGKVPGRCASPSGNMRRYHRTRGQEERTNATNSTGSCTHVPRRPWDPETHHLDMLPAVEQFICSQRETHLLQQQSLDVHR